MGKAAIKVIRQVLFLFSILFLGSMMFNVSPVAASDFSADRAYSHVKELSQKIGPRSAGSAGELKAAQYIRYVLEQSGWKVKDQPFSKVVVTDSFPLIQQEQKIELINSQNVIAELPGNTPNWIVIGAHYDTASSSVPGAVDNGSGVGVLLELARVLAQEKHEMGYQIVFFGAEEKGLVGSSYYVSQADLSGVDWMLNLDMIGSPLEIDGAGSISAPGELVKKVSDLARENNLPFRLSRDAFVMTRESTQGGSSDFSPFLKQGIPAIGLGIAGRPSGYYHRPEDTIDHLSLDNLQKLGDFSYQLVTSVSLNKVGERTWDEFYLPFQIGSHVFVLPEAGVRILYLMSFGLFGFVSWQVLKLPKQGWKPYAWTGVTVLGLGLLVTVLSSSGEMIWMALKGSENICQAYPQWFLAARLGILILVLLILSKWLKRLPLARAPKVTWMLAAGALSFVSISAALMRIDLAFPFVFWLLCLTIQWRFPHPLIALSGPFFLYYWHWDMLNSPQWSSYYKAFYTYPIVFIILYGLMISAMLLSLLHSISSPGKIPWGKWLKSMIKPALFMLPVMILLIGLIPSYTGVFPQNIQVREEWVEDEGTKVRVASDDVLPKALVRQLNSFSKSVDTKKEIVFPTVAQESPMQIAVKVNERAEKQRILDVGVQLAYKEEPETLTLRLESSQPFQIKQVNGFLPLDKLPKKVELKGKAESNGKYVLVLQRNLPQDQAFNFTVEAEGSLTCMIEGTFANLKPALLINLPHASMEYQSVVRRTVSF